MKTTQHIRPVSNIVCTHCNRMQSSDGRLATYNIADQTVTIGCEHGDCYKYSTSPSKGVRVRCTQDPSCIKIDTLGVSYHDHALTNLFGGK